MGKKPPKPAKPAKPKKGPAKGAAVTAGEAAKPSETMQMISAKDLRRLINDKASTMRQVSEEMTGPLGTRIKKAVDEKHLDKMIFNIICAFDKLDQRTLSRKLATLYHYLDVSGLDTKASSQPDMFEAGRSRPIGAASAPNGKAKADEEVEEEDESTGTSLAPADQTNVTQIRKGLN